MSKTHPDWGQLITRITAAAFWLAAAFTAIAIGMTLGSYVFAERAFDLVKQHFGEPFSTYPQAAVTLFFLSTATLSALAAHYLRQLYGILRSAKNGAAFTPANTARLRTMAWLMLAMHLMLYPVGYLALAVETAFKGPTSEITMAYSLIAYLALLTAFALADICRKASGNHDFSARAT